MIRLSEKEFDRAVERALSRIPDEIAVHLENVLVTVQRRPSPELLEDMGVPSGETLLGLYQGVPLDERSVMDLPSPPDTIFIFQEPLEEMCESGRELEREIEITVVHEIAHHLGIEEDRLIELGYG